MNKNKLNLEILNSEIDNIDHNSGYNLIFVNDLMLNAELGVYAHEKNIQQPLRVNVIAKIKDIPDTSNEKIDNVVCYNQISLIIKEIVNSGHTILLETLAEKILQECFKNNRIETIKIRLEKLDAIDDAESAGIEIERSRK
ncbi:dihydroneopterin aldolase [Pelagibacterales bacterium]|jgi:dihydroneopterin aldolase|nr:dihydroneopterin aldolase [Pelagibacterales bacterium]MBL6861489.1 dihydroneopterin aldolase [Pelagibacterales bacterium]MDA7764026.1 dihydroneopterin aldolase [Pelagibacterales bacterium]MDA9897012.1 dihydroneopterin aldolase [Pelagibacterales bacterium]MDB9985879.1 dihydroneopterin aldolase [Pelagibacterales bacterium]|tara:strand:- start:3220 stop:3642 length:423 start_codon:yes stop_codon:yes gene_type:complete